MSFLVFAIVERPSATYWRRSACRIYFRRHAASCHLLACSFFLPPGLSTPYVVRLLGAISLNCDSDLEPEFSRMLHGLRCRTSSRSLHQGAATLGTNGWHAPTLDSEQKFQPSRQSSNTSLSYRHSRAGSRLHHGLGCSEVSKCDKPRQARTTSLTDCRKLHTL